jgi:hypothetical protein
VFSIFVTDTSNSNTLSIIPANFTIMAVVGSQGATGATGRTGPTGPAGIPAFTVSTTGMTGGSGQFAFVHAVGGTGSAGNPIAGPTSNTNAMLARCIGAYEGVIGQLVFGGIVPDAQLTTASGQPQIGAPLYLASNADDANTGAGKLTQVKPVAVGTVAAQVAIVIDNSAYASQKRCKVLIQITSTVQN